MNWRALLKTRFLAAAGVLLVAAVSLNAVTSAMKIVLIKEPIDLARPLATMPERLGHDGRYVLVRREPRLPKDVEDALGTKTYISYLYRDTQMDEDASGAFIRMHVPYYTGTIDTVPHVPDRCFVAGGAQPSGKRVSALRLTSPRIAADDDGRLQALTALGNLVSLPDRTVPTTLVHFKHPKDETASYTVGYFFVANNQYTATPEGVRLQAFNLFDRYAYYCKVELMPGTGIRPDDGQVRLLPDVGDTEVAQEIMADFLAAALPEIMLCLPDWDRLTEQQTAAAHLGDAEDGV